MDPKVVTQVIEMLNKEYGKVADLTIARGRVHNFLGMKIDFSKKGKVMISMQSYIEQILDEVPDDMAGTATSPAADHLFKVRANPTLLSPKSAELFHHIVTQLLFVCKHA